jgi:hypothetical protein
MTCCVVPCGISVLDGLTAKKKQGPSDARPKRLESAAVANGRGMLARGVPDAQVLGWWSSQVAHEADAARLTDWDPRVLCAETSTLAAAGHSPQRGLLDRGDRVMLLASDTGPGVAAALCVGQYIAGLALADTTYVSTPEGLPNEPVTAPAGGQLTIVRLRGLNPAHAAGGFIDAVAGIGRVLRAAFDTGERIEVHLTGGYKATLLHTLAMTEVLYSQDPDRVTALYVFEGADDPGSPAVSIGLRRFPPEYIDDMAAELSAVRDGRREPGAQTFKGMAWTEAGGLTAFGYGYLAVLGHKLSSARPGPTG